MTGQIIELSFFMWIVAILAFLPFAYFIYAYVNNNEYGPFADKPEAHKKQPGLEDKLIGLIEKFLHKKG
jgi:hypothetical protein